MIKKSLFLLFTLILSSCALLPIHEARVNGVFKIGELGDFKYDYVKLYPDGSVKMLNRFSGGDDLAVIEITKDSYDDGWHYMWLRGDLHLYKHTKTAQMHGGYEITTDGFIVNSTFLVTKDNKIVNELKPRPVTNQKKLKVLSLSGEPLNNETYTSVRHILDSDSFVVEGGNGAKIINKKGKNLTPYYVKIDEFHGPYARFYNGMGWGLISKSGEIVLEPNYEKITNFNDGFVGIFNHGKLDLLDLTRKVLVFKGIDNFDIGKTKIIAIKRTPFSAWTYYDNQGNKLKYTSQQKKAFSSGIPGIDVISTAKDHIAIDSSGKVLATLSSKFIRFIPLSKERFIATYRYNYDSLVDNNLNPIISGIKINMFAYGNIERIVFDIDGKHGLLDYDGNIIIKGQYKDIGMYSNDYLTLRYFDSKNTLSRVSKLYSIKKEKIIDSPLAEYSVLPYYFKNQNGKLIPFKKEKEWGLYDVQTGETKMFQDIYSIRHKKYGYFAAMTKDGSIILDEGYNVIYKSDSRTIDIISDQLAITRVSNDFGIVNFKTGKYVFAPTGRNTHYQHGIVVQSTNLF